MAFPYKLTVPKNRGELEDLLGWMVLAGPDFKSSLQGADIDTAFEELSLGLQNVIQPRPTLELLQNMSGEVRRCFETNELKRAIGLLDEMILMVRDKSVH